MEAILKEPAEPRRELLIGCGSDRQKKVFIPDHPKWSNLVTLDHNPDHKPDIVHDLEKLPLPFEDNRFDEIHAYEVLEHIRTQGDWRGFFADFSEYWRILKPGGLLIGTCPMWNSKWAWGDPSHRRIVGVEQFTFLNQEEYTKQVGKTPMNDFRHWYKADFALRLANQQNGQLVFVLQAIKPSRIAEAYR